MDFSLQSELAVDFFIKEIGTRDEFVTKVVWVSVISNARIGLELTGSGISFLSPADLNMQTSSQVTAVQIIEAIILKAGGDQFINSYLQEHNHRFIAIQVGAPGLVNKNPDSIAMPKSWVVSYNTLQREALAMVEAGYGFVCSGKDPVTGKAIYVDVEANNITYRMNAGSDAATAMDNGVRIFERMGSPVMPVVRDFNNVNHENVPIADAITISTLQGADALGYWQQKGVMVDAINAATTTEELEAISTVFTVNTV